jgi:hypothetical protein
LDEWLALPGPNKLDAAKKTLLPAAGYHTDVGKEAGFAEPTMQALVAGQNPASLLLDESVAFDFTQRLTDRYQLASEL